MVIVTSSFSCVLNAHSGRCADALVMQCLICWYIRRKLTLDFNHFDRFDCRSASSCGHDPYKDKNQGQGSVGSKDRVEANGRTDGHDRLQYLARKRAVGSNIFYATCCRKRRASM